MVFLLLFFTTSSAYLMLYIFSSSSSLLETVFLSVLAFFIKACISRKFQLIFSRMFNFPKPMYVKDTFK